jgi:hypothetical protein
MSLDRFVATGNRSYATAPVDAERLRGAPEHVLDCFEVPHYEDRYIILTNDWVRDSVKPRFHYFASNANPNRHMYWAQMLVPHVEYYRTANAGQPIRWLDIPVEVREAFLDGHEAYYAE